MSLKELQTDLITLLKSHTDEKNIGGAILMVFDRESQPTAMITPGINEPEMVRELLCRGISVSFTPRDAS